MVYLQLIGGFALLLGAAEIMVRGAVGLARRLGISPLVIGMTVIAFGTSLPELLVSLQAGLGGSPGIAVGNVIGSNVANILLILGAACAIKPLTKKPPVMNRDTFVLAFCTALFVGLCWLGEIGLWSGVALIVLLAVFMISSYMREAHDPMAAAGHDKEVEELSQIPSSLWITVPATLGGLAGIALGADLLVDGGVTLARDFGVSEEVIGLTLVAFGTSLPELAASVVAALRGHGDVAFGNVVGSNLFNMLAIAGIVSVVVPLPVADTILAYDLWIMSAATLALIPIMTGHLKLSRAGGALFLTVYVAYIFSLTQGVGEQAAARLF